MSADPDERFNATCPPACRSCDGSGIIWTPDADGESAYEVACPDPVHDAARETVTASPDPGHETTDWYVIIPGAPWGGRTAVFGPMPEDKARSEYVRLADPFIPECAPKLVRVVEDYAQEGKADHG